MSVSVATDRRIDALVYSLTIVMILGFIGMMANVPFLIFLALPAIIAVLLYLSVSDIPDTTRRRTIMGTLHTFNVISVALWVIALLTLDNTDQWLAGLPASTAVLFLFGWPFYSIVGGVMYAYIASISGILKLQEEHSEGEPEVVES